MCDFQPGDVVICVSNTPKVDSNYNESLNRIVVGQTYNVDRTYPPSFDRDVDGVLLSQVMSSHPQGTFRHDHFRRVYRPNGEFIKKLQEPVDTTVNCVSDA